MLSELAAALVLGVGSVLLTDNSLQAGTLIAFLLYLDLFFSPIQQLSQTFDSYQQARVSLDRIDELLARESSVPPADDPVVPDEIRGEVVFDDVVFRYPQTVTDALRGVRLRIPAGETVALVGETGAGKSTVLKLVARFYDPSSGRVLVDGVPVDRYDAVAYHRHLGIVPQEAYLFSGTIRDNIAFGRADATDAEVEAAARAVSAHDFIAALPAGYLTHVSERGRSLSSGQRQLIALARAHLVDPAILLLDEATSNLDLATEARVTAAMRVAPPGGGPRSSSRTACRPPGSPIGSSWSTTVASSRTGPMSPCSHRGGRYARLWEASTDTAPARPSRPGVACTPARDRALSPHLTGRQITIPSSWCQAQGGTVRGFRWLAVIVALVLVAGACSRSDNKSSSNGATTSTTTSRHRWRQERQLRRSHGCLPGREAERIARAGRHADRDQDRHVLRPRLRRSRRDSTRSSSTPPTSSRRGATTAVGSTAARSWWTSATPH